jgi:hypothetical protein
MKRSLFKTLVFLNLASTLVGCAEQGQLISLRRLSTSASKGVALVDLGSASSSNARAQGGRSGGSEPSAGRVLSCSEILRRANLGLGQGQLQMNSGQHAAEMSAVFQEAFGSAGLTMGQFEGAAMSARFSNLQEVSDFLSSQDQSSVVGHWIVVMLEAHMTGAAQACVVQSSSLSCSASSQNCMKGKTVLEALRMLERFMLAGQALEGVGSISQVNRILAQLSAGFR